MTVMALHLSYLDMLAYIADGSSSSVISIFCVIFVHVIGPMHVFNEQGIRPNKTNRCQSCQLLGLTN